VVGKGEVRYERHVPARCIDTRALHCWLLLFDVVLDVRFRVDRRGGVVRVISVTGWSYWMTLK
jgi:hypothetical protein